MLDGAALNETRGLQIQVDLLSEFVVFWTIGGVPIVKRNVKPIEIGLSTFGNVGHKLLWGDAGLLRGNHDGRAMGVVCTDKIHALPLHALITHPNIGLDVLHDVADVEVSIGIRKGGGDKELAHGHRN